MINIHAFANHVQFNSPALQVLRISGFHTPEPRIRARLAACLVSVVHHLPELHTLSLNSVGLDDVAMEGLAVGLSTPLQQPGQPHPTPVQRPPVALDVRGNVISAYGLAHLLSVDAIASVQCGWEPIHFNPLTPTHTPHSNALTPTPPRPSTAPRQHMRHQTAPSQP